MHELTRRDALRLGAGALPLAAALRLPAGADAQASPVPGIRKPLPPELFAPQGTNAEMRWSAMQGAGYRTPNDRFFVRNHTATPLIDARRWRLQVFGSGLRGRPGREDAVTFSLRQLEKLESKSVLATVECAGNARTGFEQQGSKAKGTAWGLGAVGVASWRGVPLREVLERAGLTARAVDVMPEGLDATVKADDGTDQGHVRRPLPIAKALDDCLLAYEMNGRDLPADHGAPVRLIVPGWVGIANIKWVGAIEVAATALASYWNTTQYRFVGPTYPADSPPLTRMPLKSAFELDPGTTFTAGKRVTLRGRSWSGGTVPAKVEVSADGGATWKLAERRRPNPEQAWVRWAFDWTPSAPGPVDLIARATDRKGHVQPATQAFNANGYEFGAWYRLRVNVAA